LRLWVTTSTSVSGTVPKNLNAALGRVRGWRVSVMPGAVSVYAETCPGHVGRNGRARLLEPKGLSDGKP